MLNFRKSISLVMSLLLLVVFVLAGCSGASGTQSQESSKSDSSQASSQPSTEPQLQPVNLVWYMLFPPQPEQNAVFDEANKYLKEKINAQVDFRTLDFSNFEQKVQTAAAAGEEFDLLWIGDWMNTVKYDDFVSKGAIIPLDDLITKYAPGTQKFIDQKFWDMMKIDGKIYGVPNYQIFCRAMGIWLRKDLVDKYKFDYKNVKSYKDFEPFFQQIIDGEEDVTPLAVNSMYMGFFPPNSSMAVDGGLPEYKSLQAGMFAWATDLTKASWEYDDPVMSKWLLDNMKVARDWYLKGFVRKDLLSMLDMDPDIKAGKFAAGFNIVKPGGEAEYKEKYGFDVVFVQTSTPILSGVKATELSISATSKKPERAMMLIELLNTDKYLYNLLANGIEGKNYVKVGDNRISRVENNGYQPGIDWALGNTTIGYLTPGKSDDVYEQTIKMNNEAKAPIMPDFSLNYENIKNEEAAATALWKEIGEPLWTGVLDPDKVFQQYVQKQRDIGIEKILDEVQRQLDEYWKTHNK